MANYIPSPEQKGILNSNLTLINVNYDDPLQALECISMQIRNHVIAGRNTLVVVPDKQARLHLVSLLSDLSLSAVTLAVEMLESPNKFKFDSFKTDPEKSANQGSQSYTNTVQFNKKQEAITALIQKKYNALEPSSSWRQAVDTYCSLEIHQEVLLISRWLETSDFEMSEEEMQALLDTISEALTYYHPEFEVKDYSLLNKELNKKFSEEGLLKDTIDKIVEMIATGEQLKNRYLAYGKDLEDNFMLHHLHTIDHLKSEAESCKYKITQWLSVQNELNKSLLPGFLSEKQKVHQQKGKEILNETAQLFKEVGELTHVHFDTPNKIIVPLIQSCGEVAPVLDNFMSTLHLRKMQYLKSANMHNHLDPVLRDLDADLKSLAGRINEASFLHEKIEINTLSFDKQTEIIIELVRKLSLLRVEAEQSMYYLEWKGFFQQKSELEQKILLVLKRIPTQKWIDAIRGWYLMHRITKDYLHLQPITKEAVDELREANARNEAALTHSKLATIFEQREDKLKSLKKAKPELFKFLASENSSLNQETWKHIFEQYYEDIESFFPVIITDNDQLSKLQHSENRDHIVFDNKESSVEIMQLFKSITYYWSDRNHVDNPEFNLKLASGFVDFKTLKATERFPLFRGLAHLLLTLPVFPDIYLLHNACILSYASSYIDEKLHHALYHYGIKKIIGNPNEREKTISGALLEAEHAIYVLVEDGLFCPKDTQDLLWQNKISSILNQSGFQLLNIDSSILFNHEAKINEIIEDITIQQGHYKNQLTIEFN